MPQYNAKDFKPTAVNFKGLFISYYETHQFVNDKYDFEYNKNKIKRNQGQTFLLILIM